MLVGLMVGMKQERSKKRVNRRSSTQIFTRRRAVGMRGRWVRFGGARGGSEGGLDPDGSGHGGS